MEKRKYFDIQLHAGVTRNGEIYCSSQGFPIDSHMRGPIGVKFSGIVGANSENVLGPQKNCFHNIIVCRKNLGNTV